MSLKDTILGAVDRPSQAVEVLEWGCTVMVRTLSGAERDAFESETFEAKGRINKQNIRARFLALCLCDAEGNRIFTTAEDAKKLGEKSAAVLDRLFEIAQKMNGLTQADVDELAKNS